MEKKAADSKREVASPKVAKRQKVGMVAVAAKGEVVSEQVAKRRKVGTVTDTSKAECPNSGDYGTKMASPQAAVDDQKKSGEIPVVQRSSKPLTAMELHEPRSLKQYIRPLAPPGAPFVLNRFKLDNRPTAFRIAPPLPTGLENIDVLKEHFSSYGELSSVELEDGDSSDSTATNNHSALIYFTTRRSAERAFVSGKCWKGHTLQFIWMA